MVVPRPHLAPEPDAIPASFEEAADYLAQLADTAAALARLYEMSLEETLFQAAAAAARSRLKR